ncbi:probable BOI-related E3 ubiquitin-protein ligase 3 [Diospyros lotus]|uniref:probable BOI-related E3 ubiquitin-protein ligase 3 n=1 Tax=Diospyros lotus TaxID=55363 RepID=UPI002251D3DC|nr:probable BOI-related E3 ubiquitin-protein ligase 3 [Diospyros lotus]
MAIHAQMYPDNFGFSLGPLQNWVDNAYAFNDFSFNLQQKQEQQQLQILQHKIPIPCFENTGLVSKTYNDQSMAFSPFVGAQVEKHRQEIDRFVSLQSQRLRLALHEQRKQQIALILRKYEAKTAALLKQKDEEISKAMNRTVELEDFLRRMESESQTWRRAAQENEAMVASLNNTIEQLKVSACFANGVAEDAESCCDLIDRDDDERTDNKQDEKKEKENGEGTTRKMVCKGCNSRLSCVVFLPCRHLCSCQSCQPYLDSCPVCGTVKKRSIEALV